jgi:hypothetical protein
VEPRKEGKKERKKERIVPDSLISVEILRKVGVLSPYIGLLSFRNYILLNK